MFSVFLMPVVVLNMACEMVFVLQQRLVAQGVRTEKAAKVLSDIVAAVFEPVFLDSLFEPQQVTSQESLAKIFERLAHASIMRLSENSMSKLLDLMSMSFKYQIMSLAYPSELSLVSENHFVAVREIIESNAAAAALVTAGIERFHARYDDLTWGDWDQLRQSLLQVFKDRRTKISLFLQQHMQGTDGKFIVNLKGGAQPPCTMIPGTIRYFDSSGGLQRSETFDSLATIELCELPLDERSTTLGLNVYGASGGPTKRRRKRVSGTRERLSATTRLSSEQLKRRERQQTERMVRQELTSLADLIHGPSRDSTDAFALNLFPEGAAAPRKARTKATAAAEALELESDSDGDEVIVVECDAAAVSAKDIAKDLDLGAPAGGGDGDDLLSLMDSVA